MTYFTRKSTGKIWIGTLLVVGLLAVAEILYIAMSESQKNEKNMPASDMENQSLNSVADYQFTGIALGPVSTQVPLTVERELGHENNITVIEGFTGPYGIKVTPDGLMYVSDLKEGRVVKISVAYYFQGCLGRIKGEETSPSSWHMSGEIDRSAAEGALVMPHSVDFAQMGRCLLLII